MKPDEREFLQAVAAKAAGESVRQVIARLGIHHKRAWYLLEKWTDRGWYEYGVNLELGWLTEKGKEAAREQ